MVSLFWIQSGGCGGDTMSFLNAQSPDLIELFDSLGISLLWHPSLSNGHTRRFDQLIEQILAGEQPLDILCVEGSIITGPRTPS